MSDQAVEQLAQQRLEAAERRLSRKPVVTLAATGRDFWRYPSPWIVAAYLVGSVTARLAVGGWAWTDLLAPVVFLALFPVVEWLIHVFILHWRPRRIAGVEVDSLLARDHRRHHADPRDVPLVFIPWRALLWVLGDHVRHQRPAARDLPRPGDRRVQPDGQGPARPRRGVRRRAVTPGHRLYPPGDLSGYEQQPGVTAGQRATRKPST